MIKILGVSQVIPVNTLTASSIIDNGSLILKSTTDSVTTGANATLNNISTPIIRVTSSSLTGLDMIPAGVDGQEITLSNDTGSSLIVNNDSGSTPANRIFTGAGTSIVLLNRSSIKLQYNSTSQRWYVIGGSGSGSVGAGNLDILLSQPFDGSSLVDFVQTGLELLDNPNIQGTKTARLTHQPSTIQSFKQIKSVDNKFRGKNVNLELEVRSTAQSGNVTIQFYDESNSQDIGTVETVTTGSELISADTNLNNVLTNISSLDILKIKVGQSITGSGIPAGTIVSDVDTMSLTVTISKNATSSSSEILSISDISRKQIFYFDIPLKCSSLSYTVKALAESDFPETYIDDLVIQLSPSSSSVTPPVINSDLGYIDEFGNTVMPLSPILTSIVIQASDLQNWALTADNDGNIQIETTTNTASNILFVADNSQTVEIDIENESLVVNTVTGTGTLYDNIYLSAPNGMVFRLAIDSSYQISLEDSGTNSLKIQDKLGVNLFKIQQTVDGALAYLKAFTGNLPTPETVTGSLPIAIDASGSGNPILKLWNSVSSSWMTLITKETKSDAYPVGTIITSFLDLQTFRTEMNDTGTVKKWKMLDGSSVATDDLKTVLNWNILPDGRGKFLRMMDDTTTPVSDSDVESRLRHQSQYMGSYQDDAMQGHRHFLGSSDGDNTTSGQNVATGWTLTGAAATAKNVITASIILYANDPRTDNTNGTPRTTSETRPKNITVNYFVKVNR
jgi:hypothetical protein